MLQYSTIEPGTLELLRALMEMPELSDFYLAGGTALALYYGHRKSVDLDLFSNRDFEDEAIVTLLNDRFADFSYNSFKNPVGIFSFIGQTKVDFVRYYRHDLLEPITAEDGIRLASLADLAAMKLSAILKRGVKKDFWDISRLLDQFSVADLIAFYQRKFPGQQLLISIPQALTYFADADESEEPICLLGYSWKDIKTKIQRAVSEYMQ